MTFEPFSVALLGALSDLSQEAERLWFKTWLGGVRIGHNELRDLSFL